MLKSTHYKKRVESDKLTVIRGVDEPVHQQRFCCVERQADIQMAKELGMKPKSLIKNIPSPKRQWKAPVKYWIRDLYEKKFGSVLDSKKLKTNKP